MCIDFTLFFHRLNHFLLTPSSFCFRACLDFVKNTDVGKKMRTICWYCRNQNFYSSKICFAFSFQGKFCEYGSFRLNAPYSTVFNDMAFIAFV